eukprot:4294422-Amphidinium_carterae.1
MAVHTCASCQAFKEDFVPFSAAATCSIAETSDTEACAEAYHPTKTTASQLLLPIELQEFRNHYTLALWPFSCSSEAAILR